ncbi:MAG: hypothetical protein K2K94_10875 [Muribaculaceae bacterium]|nr:hypothetical protein [Muribaculaceae bacterium]
MTSQPFAIPSRSYINRLAFTWLANRWWLLAMPLVAVSVWALFDIRAIYVGLVIIFLLYPMSLTLVWFDYALSPQSIRAITTKQVTVEAGGLKLDFFPKNDDCKPLPSVFITWNEIRAAELSSNALTLVLGQRLDDRLTLPCDVFSPEAWILINTKIADKLPSPETI